MNTLSNSVQLIGHIGIDPELKKTQNDKCFVSIPMATTERYLRQGEWKTDTQWHRLILWEKAAEKAVDNLKKGSFIAVEGKISYNTYMDAQGITRYSTDIRALNYMILNKKGKDEEVMHSQITLEENEDDDLPF